MRWQYGLRRRHRCLGRDGDVDSCRHLDALSTALAVPVPGVVLYDVSDLVKQVRSGVVSVTETGFTMDMFMRQVQTEGEGTASSSTLRATSSPTTT